MIVLLASLAVSEHPRVMRITLLVRQVKIVLDPDEIVSHHISVNNVVCLLCAYIDDG